MAESHRRGGWGKVLSKLGKREARAVVKLKKKTEKKKKR